MLELYSISLLWVIIIIIFNYFVLNPMLPSFASLVGITGSHNEDEPIFDAFLASSEEP